MAARRLPDGAVSMATGGHGRRTATRIAVSLLLGLALVVGATGPGHAQPDTVPHPGARPDVNGPVPLPDGSYARIPSAGEQLTGPLAAQIAETELEIDKVSGQLNALELEVGPAQSAVEYAQREWELARDERQRRQDILDELVDASFRGAAAVPQELFLPQLPGLSVHAPGLPVEVPIGVQTAARELIEAKETEQRAFELLTAAQEAEQTLTDLRNELADQLEELQDKLADLQARNTRMLIEQARREEARQQQQAAHRYPALQPVNGFRAGDAAIAAVKFALSQLGKPYQWGAEGPHRYDCSGLVWRAYREQGIALPRVAADQYWATRTMLVTRSAAVAQRGLLPGDLVFFSSGPAWQSIHHVGIYVGDGQMVHAPNRNDVVKVSPVWWSRFFAATRVVEAERVVDPEPTPTPRPTTSPTPSPTVSPTPGPTTSPTPGPSPTTSPTTSPSPSPTVTSTPDPEPSSPDPDPGSPSPDPTETPPPASSPPPSSPTPSGSPATTGTPAPTVTATPS